MNRSRRQLLPLLLLLGLLLIAAGWSLRTLQANRAAAAAAAEDLAACRQLLARIDVLEEQPTQADAAQMRMTDLTRLIEDAARQAALSQQQLVRIFPEPPRRTEAGPYQRQDTQVLLRQVSLEQLTRLLTALRAGSSKLRATALRLSAPRTGEASALWTAELTLSYLIYAPQEPAAALARQDLQP